MPRLLALLAIPALSGVLLIAACGSSNDDAGAATADAWSPEAIAESQSQIKAQQVGSQVGLGRARLSFGILQPDPDDPNAASLVHNAVAHATLYKLDGETGTPEGDYDLTPVTLEETTTHKHADGTVETHEDPLATVYVANVELDSTEWWGADLSIQVGDQHYDHVKVRFFVAEDTTEPGIGDPVPPSTQLTTADVDDVAKIDSSTTPRPELHDMTVADAISSGTPSLIAFATPAFCQTRFCGPVIDSVVVPLEEKYGDRANFLHIEPYDLQQARQGKLVAIPQMQEWGLQSEPWVFVLDANGHVAAKFEGIMSEEEVEPVLQRVIDGQVAARD